MRLIQPLLSRDFRLLWVGRTVSMLGDGIFTVALVWQTAEINRSPRALTVVLLARTIPRLALLLVGGAFGDRLPRRAVLLSTELVQGTAVGLIAIGAATSQLTLVHLITLNVVVGAAQAFFLPVSTAIIPELLPPNLIAQGNALDASTRLAMAEFLGPAMGGAIISIVGSPAAFGLDAITFLIGAIAVGSISIRPTAEAKESRLIRDLTEGFRYVAHRKWLWVTLGAAGIGNFLFSGSMAVLAPLFILNVLDAGPAGLGAAFACVGVGGAIGALIGGHLPLPSRQLVAVLVAYAAAGATLVVIAVSQRFWIALVAFTIQGFLLEYGNVLWSTMLQTHVLRNYLARVSSLDWVLSFSLYPISLAIAGIVAESYGVARVLGIAGTSQLLFSLMILLVPDVRVARGVSAESDLTDYEMSD